MSRSTCWTCGNSYDGVQCRVCARNRQHEEQIEATERAAQQQAEQAARQEELLERQREAVEEAAERHRTTTANAWKLQAEAKSERAYTLYQSGMFEEAHRLAVQSIEQDPGNLDGFGVAASSLISLGQPAAAKSNLEKQIQLLNLSEYRDSPKSFAKVLNLLSKQNDLFSLGNAYSSALKQNIRFWNNSRDAVAAASALAGQLITLEKFSDARSTLDWLLQSDPSSQETWSIALRLIKQLVARSDSTTARQISEQLSLHCDTLLSQCFMYEISSCLGTDPKKRLDAFLQKVKFDFRESLQSDIPRIRMCGGREFSRETVEEVMRSICEKYSGWKSAIEGQIYETTVAGAKSVHVETRGGTVGVISFVLLTMTAVFYCFSHSIRLESTGPYFPFGVLFGAILAGVLFGSYVKRSKIYQETKSRLASSYTNQNSTFANLGLPLVTPRSVSGVGYLLVIYVGAFTCYVVGWLAIMISQGQPIAATIPGREILAPNDSAAFIDELTDSSLGNAYGITWARELGNHGAVFKSENESRIEYPGKIPAEGTIEFWIKVNSGYQYQDYTLKQNLESAMIFSTDPEGGDVTWPGTTKLLVSMNGNVSLFVARNKYNKPATPPIEVQGTPFRFGEWHAIGFSYGRQGEFIMVDDKQVAADPSRTQPLGFAGTHQSPDDIPTIGETVSHFWAHHRFDGGFEGVVARFRVSPKQKDWNLSRGIGLQARGNNLSGNADQIIGRWSGTVSNKSAELILVKEEQGEVLSGHITYGGVTENLAVALRDDGDIVLRGTNYEKEEAGVTFYLDTFEGHLSPDAKTISGTFLDQVGNRGEWSVSKTEVLAEVHGPGQTPIGSSMSTSAPSCGIGVTGAGLTILTGGNDQRDSKTANSEGLKLLKAGQVEAAKNCFIIAARTDNSSVEALNNLGYVYQLSGEFQTSEDYLLKVIQLEPERKVAYGNLGYTEAELGKHDLAVTYFREYIRLFGNEVQGKAALMRAMTDPDEKVQWALAEACGPE